MKKYFVYTVMGNFSYVICTDGEGNFFVENNPSDDMVAKWDWDMANTIAERNSVDGIVYKVKEVV